MHLPERALNPEVGFLLSDRLDVGEIGSQAGKVGVCKQARRGSNSRRQQSGNLPRPGLVGGEQNSGNIGLAVVPGTALHCAGIAFHRGSGLDRTAGHGFGGCGFGASLLITRAGHAMFAARHVGAHEAG